MSPGLGGGKVFARRIGLMAIADDGIEDGDRLFLIAHRVGDAGLLPCLERGDILRFVGEQVEVADNADCRAVRGFVGAPVDGSTKSGSWDGKMWEYHRPDGGVGVEYNYLKGDGLHITLADNDGFNALVVRGGIKAKLYRDVQKYDDPA